MSTKRALPRFVIGLFSVVLACAVIAAGATPALAQGNPPLWFQFNVGSVDADENTSHVSVVLRDQATCKGDFLVYTAENWNYWGMPAMGDPVGRATDIGYGHAHVGCGTGTRRLLRSSWLRREPRLRVGRLRQRSRLRRTDRPRLGSMPEATVQTRRIAPAPASHP